MALQRGSYINLTEPRSKKKRRVDNSDWRPWSDLPEALLDLIMQSLGAIDYLMFGCVCKGGGYMLLRTSKSLWHTNLHFLSSYQGMLRELVTSIASLITGFTRQNCPTLLENRVQG